MLSTGRAEPPAGHTTPRRQRRGPPALDRPHHHRTAQGAALAGARQHRTKRDFALVRRGNQRCAESFPMPTLLPGWILVPL